MSAFTKELRRREKLKQQQLQQEIEDEEDSFVEPPKKQTQQNLFALLNDDDDNNDGGMNNDGDDDDNEYDDTTMNRKVSVENMKPKKNKKKNKKNKIKQQLQLQEDEELSETDTMVETGNARRTSPTTPTHQQQQQSSISELANQKKKEKKRRKKLEKQKEDDEFLEQEYRRAAELKQKDLEQISTEGDAQMRNVDWDFLKIDLNYLNPDYEFKKLFGSRALSASQQTNVHDEHLPDVIRNNKHHKLRGNSAFTKTHTLQIVTPKPHWPHYVPLGLTCTLEKIVGQLELYKIDDSLNDTYKNLQRSYAQAVASHDPENFIHLLQREHPYHVHTLLQLGEVYRTLYQEPDQAQDLIERALLALQHALNTTAFIKSLREGRARLPYTSDLNCIFYHVVLSRLHTLSRSGGHATAFELCKLLFSLSHIDHASGDPAHILLFLDYYALRAGKYEWLVKNVLPHFERVANPEVGVMPFSLLPNLMYAKAFAYYHMNDMFSANQALQDALLMWPMALGGIINECAGSQIPQWEKMTRNTVFTDQVCTSPVFSRLIHIAVMRQSFFWRQDAQIISWLKQNVEHIANQCQIGSNEFNTKQKEYLQLRKKIYQDQDIVNSYINVYEQEVMGNMLPVRSQENIDMHAGPRSEQNPIMAFLSSLLPWNDTGESSSNNQ